DNWVKDQVNEIQGKSSVRPVKCRRSHARCSPGLNRRNACQAPDQARIPGLAQARGRKLHKNEITCPGTYSLQ
ncbi:hypothetical protein HAX54_011635, partial [Datura stramonium]|nr:hypothetical protein [Datura stramonium]